MGLVYASMQDLSALLPTEILKREKAAGIAAQNRIDHHPYPVSIANCIEHINECATVFLSTTYSGGSSEPTMLTSSYATGETTRTALYTKVLAMAKTKVSCTITSVTGNTRQGQGSSASAAQSAYAVLPGVKTASISKWCRFDGTTTYTCYGASGLVTIAGLSSAIAHSASYYAKAAKPGIMSDTYETFDTQSTTLCPAVGQWGEVGTEASGTWTEASSDAVISTAAPTVWPAAQGTSIVYAGFKLTNPFAVVTWSF